MSVIQEVAEAHHATARQIFEKRGRVTPQLWAQGLSRMIVAGPIEPYKPEEITDELRAMLLCAMASRVEALYIGRSDEGYTSPFKTEGLEPGAIAKMIENDPEVRSCVITEAVAIGGEEEITILGTHGLDDWGRHIWEIGLRSNASMRTLVPLRAARDALSGGLPDFWRDEIALRQFADQMRWWLQEFPQPSLW